MIYSKNSFKIIQYSAFCGICAAIVCFASEYFGMLGNRDLAYRYVTAAVVWGAIMGAFAMSKRVKTEGDLVAVAVFATVLTRIILYCALGTTAGV